MGSTTNRRITEDIDLNKVPPLDHHRSAVSFNCLILKMTELLNNFGNQMEDALEKAEQSLDIVDRKLTLMEVKLSSVNLKQVENSFGNLEAAPIKPSEEFIVEKTSSEPQAPSTSSPNSSSVDPSNEQLKLVECSDTTYFVLIKDDPKFSKYFKMLKMGVPEAGVVQKMESEGIDPSILKRGDERSNVEVSQKSGYESSGESVSSFSDSD